MDQKLTEEIQAWLALDDSQRDYEKGALYLLRLSGNQIMYRNISMNPQHYAQMIEYQLNKYLKFRLQQLTHEEVAHMQTEADKVVARHSLSENNPAKEFKKGIRADHDQLPVEIQSLYVENLSIVQRMREVHLKLRSLSLENATCPDSERYPFLKELISLDKRLHKNWEIYDHYSDGDVAATITTADVREESKAALRRVNLTKGRYKKNPSEKLKLLIQELYPKILNPSEALTAELKELGIL